MNININNGITVEIGLVPKKNKTNKKEYCIYLSFSIYQNGMKQCTPHSISTGITVAITEWEKGTVKGRNDKAKLKNGLLDEHLLTARNMLNELSSKKIKTCSELLREIKLNIKQRITGKAPRGQKETVNSRLKDYTFENVMNCLMEKKSISKARKRGYKSSYELLKKFYGNNIPTIDQITKEELTDFMSWLDNYDISKSKRYIKQSLKTKTYAQDSTTGCKSKIAAVIKYAIEPMKIMSANPLPPNFRGQWAKSKKVTLSESEMYDFINIDETKLEQTQLIAKYCGIVEMVTGLGYQDLCNLKPENFKENTILSDDLGKITKDYIQGNRQKTGEEFTIFTPPQIKKYFDRLTSLIPFDKLPSLDYTNRIYKELALMAGINKPCTSYIFRHSFATDFMEKDGSYEDLQLILGHKNELHKTTQIYGRISLKRQSEKMEQYISRCKMHQLKVTIPSKFLQLQEPIQKEIYRYN